MANLDRKGSFFFTIVFFGGLWGLVEASLGFLLHLIPELLPIPPLSGIIMFPVGLLFMLSAKRIAGTVAAIPATAFIAAAVKVSSLALPAISFRFVRNPALAILTEGALACLVLGAGEWKVNRLLPLKAALLSFGWRSVFLALNVAFSLSGIANKPAKVQTQFIFLEGSIDAIIIITASLILWAISGKNTSRNTFRMPGPIPALGTLIIGIGMQLLFAGR